MPTRFEQPPRPSGTRVGRAAFRRPSERELREGAAAFERELAAWQSRSRRPSERELREGAAAFERELAAFEHERAQLRERERAVAERERAVAERERAVAERERAAPRRPLRQPEIRRPRGFMPSAEELAELDDEEVAELADRLDVTPADLEDFIDAAQEGLIGVTGDPKVDAEYIDALWEALAEQGYDDQWSVSDLWDMYYGYTPG